MQIQVPLHRLMYTSVQPKAEKAESRKTRMSKRPTTKCRQNGDVRIPVCVNGMFKFIYLLLLLLRGLNTRYVIHSK